MRKVRLLVIICLLSIGFLSSTSKTLAVLDNLKFGDPCRGDGTAQNNPGDLPIFLNGELMECKTPYVCLPVQGKNPREWRCQTGDPASSVIGRIIPPQAILNLGFGASGISGVLSNLVTILYSVAGVVFLFMVILSAFQWITSGGEKENVAKARGRLTWAMVGIALLALSFVILRVLGDITGFKFFV